MGYKWETNEAEEEWHILAGGALHPATPDANSHVFMVKGSYISMMAYSKILQKFISMNGGFVSKCSMITINTCDSSGSSRSQGETGTDGFQNKTAGI